MTPSTHHAKSRCDPLSTISGGVRCPVLSSVKVKFIPLSMSVCGLHMRWLKSAKIEMYLEGKF